MRAPLASLLSAALLAGAFAASSLASSGCGGKGRPSSTIPEAQLEPATPVTPVEQPAAPTPPAAPAPPPQPLQVAIEPAVATVKLLSAGKGARAKLRLSPAAAGAQKVELLMDAVIEQAPSGKPVERVKMPVVVLAGASQVSAVGADGVAAYQTVIESVDVRAEPDQVKPTPAEVKEKLTSLVGMKIDGSVSAAGGAGATTYAVEKPDGDTPGAVESLKMMMPTWTQLPEQPIGLGARWQVTSPVVWNGIATTQVTTYTLVSRTAASAVITGETKVTGANQKLDDVDVSDISGTGKVEATIEPGKLYPRLARTITTKVKLKKGADEVLITVQVGSAFEPK